MYKKLFIVFLLLTIGLVGLNKVDSSSATTYTFAFDRKHNFVITQDAFLPDYTILELELDGPEDLYIDTHNQIFVADTGNSRVVVYDGETNTIIREITHEEFSAPKGVYVTEDDFLFVADSVASKIFKFDGDGNFVESFSKPTSVSFANKNFDPKKIAVDSQGNMYVVAEGVYDGIIQLSSSGEFLGFFATNDVQLSLRQQLENLLFSDRQLEQVVDRNPVSFSNVYVDEDGLVYSTSFGLNISNLKKHNTDGSSSIDTNYGVDLELVDVYTDHNGIIYAASASGQIFIFTSDGSFIFVFGTGETNEDVSGFYSDLAGIAVDQNGKVWTIDSTKSFLQSYTATEYSSTIFEALTLYKQGKYDEAVVMWDEVLKLNQLSVLAHNEIGRNLYSQGEYEESMEHFILSGNRYLYSESYWEVRNVSLQSNLPTVIIGLFFATIAYFVVKLTNRKYQYLATPIGYVKKVGEIRIINDVLYGFNLFKHPLDSFYYLKRKQKGSYKGATILFLGFFVSYMINLTSKGFMYQYVEAADLDLNAIVIGFFAISGIFILSNYLVTSINDGEGSLGEIYKGFSYSLVPITLGMLLTTFLSHYVTTNEVILLDFVYTSGIVVSGVFIFLAVQELHNYTIRETIKSFLLTFLFMMIVALLFSFIQIMGDQLIQFIIGLIKEAIRNVF
jgi:tetratricopeptide (TPR) repeat protein